MQKAFETIKYYNIYAKPKQKPKSSLFTVHELIFLPRSIYNDTIGLCNNNKGFCSYINLTITMGTSL